MISNFKMFDLQLKQDKLYVDGLRKNTCLILISVLHKTFASFCFKLFLFRCLDNLQIFVQKNKIKNWLGKYIFVVRNIRSRHKFLPWSCGLSRTWVRARSPSAWLCEPATWAVNKQTVWEVAREWPEVSEDSSSSPEPPPPSPAPCSLPWPCAPATFPPYGARRTRGTASLEERCHVRETDRDSEINFLRHFQQTALHGNKLSE